MKEKKIDSFYWFYSTYSVQYPDMFSYCWIGMGVQKMNPNF